MSHFNSKKKGGSFERDTCRLISKFWSAGAFDDLVWRAASSGAKGTATRTKNKAYHSDVVATSPDIEPLMTVFSIEIKHYKDIDITEILRGLKNNKLLTFWQQTVRSSILSNRLPLLIARRNNFPTMLIARVPDAFLFIGAMKKPLKYMTLGNKLAVFSLDDFIQHVNIVKFKIIIDEICIKRGAA